MKIDRKNGLKLDNYKGVFYNDKNSQEYIDPITGAHFNYKDICKKLENFRKSQEISINELNEKKNPIKSLKLIKNQEDCNDNKITLKDKCKEKFFQEMPVKRADHKESCIFFKQDQTQYYKSEKYYNKISSQLLHSKYQSNSKFKKNSKMMQNRLESQKTFHEKFKSEIGLRETGNIIGKNLKIKIQNPQKIEKINNVMLKGLKFRNGVLSSRNINDKQLKIFIGNFAEPHNTKIVNKLNFFKLNKNEIQQRKNLSILNFDRDCAKNMSQFQTIANQNLISTRNIKCSNNFSELSGNIRLFKSMNRPSKLTQNKELLTKLYKSKKSHFVKGQSYNLLGKEEFSKTKVNLA